MRPLWRIERLRQASSTQDLVRARATAGEAEGFGIRADIQKAGRGRLGNVWESPRGNLYLSVLLRPSVPPGRMGELAFVCAVALAQAADVFVSGEIRLKWPNDLLVGSRKAAGILIETGLDTGENPYAVAGFGVNLSVAPEGAAILSGPDGPIAVEDFQGKLLNALTESLKIWDGQGFTAIRSAWLARAVGLGQTIHVRRPDGATLTGIFEDLDRDGRLVLKQTQTGKREIISAGEILSQDLVSRSKTEVASN